MRGVLILTASSSVHTDRERIYHTVQYLLSKSYFIKIQNKLKDKAQFSFVVNLTIQALELRNKVLCWRSFFSLKSRQMTSGVAHPLWKFSQTEKLCGFTQYLNEDKKYIQNIRSYIATFFILPFFPLTLRNAYSFSRLPLMPTFRFSVLHQFSG